MTDQTNAWVTNQDQNATDQNQGLITALSKMRVATENTLKKTEELIGQGAEKAEDLEMMKAKIHEMINTNDQMFEIVRSAFPNDGSDNENGSGVAGTNDDQGQQYGSDALPNSHYSPYRASSASTAVNHPRNDENTHAPHDPYYSPYRASLASTVVNASRNEGYAGAFTNVEASTLPRGNNPIQVQTHAARNRNVYGPPAKTTSDGNWSSARHHRVPPIKAPRQSKPPGLTQGPHNSSSALEASQSTRQFEAQAGLLPGDSEEPRETLKSISGKRSAIGKVAGLTANAIYGRYKRNASLVAAVKRENFEQSQLDKVQGTSAALADADNEVVKFSARDDMLLVQAYNDVKDNMWKAVGQRIKELGGQNFEAKDCAARYSQL